MGEKAARAMTARQSENNPIQRDQDFSSDKRRLFQLSWEILQPEDPLELPVEVWTLRSSYTNIEPLSGVAEPLLHGHNTYSTEVGKRNFIFSYRSTSGFIFLTEDDEVN